MAIQQKKPVEVVRRNGVFQCVRIGRQFYCIAHEDGKTWAYVQADRRLGEYRITDIPYGQAAIEYVAKGRKKHTAIVYYNTHMRKLRRLAEVEANVQHEVKCHWCDGTGQDPRNAAWACSRCS